MYLDANTMTLNFLLYAQISQNGTSPLHYGYKTYSTEYFI